MSKEKRNNRMTPDEVAHFIAQLAVNVTETGQCLVERDSKIHRAAIEFCRQRSEDLTTNDGM